MSCNGEIRFGIRASMTRWMGLALLLTAACGRQAARPDGGVGLLPTGALAPEVIAKDKVGKEVKLTALKGSSVVVYFYPKDETPGCTKEACAFRDSFSKFESKGVTLIGVSQDSETSHAAFREKHQLPFPLCADADGSVTRAYGVKSTLGMSSRVTFLVGKDGRIETVWPDVDPAVHADEVLAKVH